MAEDEMAGWHHQLDGREFESGTVSPFRAEQGTSLETPWRPRDPCRDLRGKRSPLLPLQASPDSPGESGMETRDPCLPLRGLLGPGHTPR